MKPSIKWTDVGKLFTSLGGEVRQSSGDSGRIILGDSSLSMHTHHPQNELKPYVVKRIRTLLNNEGIDNEI